MNQEFERWWEQVDAALAKVDPDWCCGLDDALWYFDHGWSPQATAEELPAIWAHDRKRDRREAARLARQAARLVKDAS